MQEGTLTERGQVSIPASLRKSMRLRPGQRLRFEAVSAREFRVIATDEKPAGPLAVLGWARRLGRKNRRTSEWMQELREGEG